MVRTMNSAAGMPRVFDSTSVTGASLLSISIAASFGVTSAAASAIFVLYCVEIERVDKPNANAL